MLGNGEIEECLPARFVVKLEQTVIKDSDGKRPPWAINNGTSAAHRLLVLLRATSTIN